jgi:hypothetical protein
MALAGDGPVAVSISFWDGYGADKSGRRDDWRQDAVGGHGVPCPYEGEIGVRALRSASLRVWRRETQRMAMMPGDRVDQ